MAQQPSNPEGNYLETVIDCISQRNSTKHPVEEDANLAKLYNQAGEIINEFSSNISRCKRYNEAKINRKYQIIIHDLETQIKRLQENLQLEQDARSPTKKHISDILQKLVVFRSQNQHYRKQNQQLQHRIQELQQQVQSQAAALIKMQNYQSKHTVERLPAINTSNSLAQTVKEYLKDKDQVRKITKNSVSNFQRLLNQLKPKLWNWNIANLLQEIDKWSEGIKQKSTEVDMWRIRSSIARKFSDYMDNPGNLVKPSSTQFQDINSLKSIRLDRIQKLKHPKQTKFSYGGSKRSLNASFQ